MRRRQFLQAALAPLVPTHDPAVDALKRVKITRVTGFVHVCPRLKFVGKNARRDVHGRNASESVLRIATDRGIEGIGVGTVDQGLARTLIGHTLDEYWKPGVGVVSPLGRSDHALYDLVGKALDEPTWKVLGGMGPAWVPVYDGSLYFNDLLPEHASRGVARLLDEVEGSLKSGHRAFKIKVGRGHKWMEAAAGLRRDVEVVRSVRRLVGNGVRLMADANNAFDLETAEHWLDAVGDELFFVEEMFPEQVDRDLMLKEFLKTKGWATRVADGESAEDLNDFEGFITHDALDVLQPGIRVFGLTRQCALARRLSLTPAIQLAPHNWGSFLGFYMQLVLARGVPNVLIAEQDPCTSDLFDTSAYEFKDGRVRVPDFPGCGLSLREEVFEKKYKRQAWTVA
jgi:L-alanine-DL-glutamate epimerase-like enolase superfamily enzyme